MQTPTESTARVRASSGGGARRANFARRYGLQIGIVGVALAIWLAFVIGAPRTFLSYPIYAAYMSTTPFFALMALPLTMLVIAGEIDLSFPSIMALGMVAFTLVYQPTQSAALALAACLLA